MYYFKNLSVLYLLLSLILLLAFAFDESGNAFISRPLGNLTGLGVVVALIGFPVAYAYIRHVASSEGRKK